ncbi:hypothetical protein F2Q70_00005174 [Brassica cretica]|uniref:Uncharacterized protein n=1 Tax=Brassica cretica TaxID=69181 RepID=A0A8S9J0Z7_BRACR|nr:hypothetical protein F2Q70_00005174 [Brassica cretica]
MAQEPSSPLVHRARSFPQYPFHPPLLASAVFPLHLPESAARSSPSVASAGRQLRHLEGSRTIGGRWFGSPPNTLTEPVKRDLSMIVSNLKLVVFSNPNREDLGKALRDWNLWGPFFFIVFLGRRLCFHGLPPSRSALLLAFDLTQRTDSVSNKQHNVVLSYTFIASHFVIPILDFLRFPFQFKLGELEAELFVIKAINDNLWRPYNELVEFRGHIESGRDPENYLKYSVQDIERIVLDFFEEYTHVTPAKLEKTMKEEDWRGNKDSVVQINGVGDMSLKSLLKDGFVFRHDFLQVVAAVHIGWILIFVFICGIKFLNFQKKVKEKRTFVP